MDKCCISNKNEGTLDARSHSPKADRLIALGKQLDILLQPFILMFDADVWQDFDEFCDSVVTLTQSVDEEDILSELRQLCEKRHDFQTKLEECTYINCVIDKAVDNLKTETAKLYRLQEKEFQTDELAASMHQKSSELKFLRQKCSKYMLETTKLKEELRRRNFNENIGNLKQICDREELQSKKDVLSKLESRLACYHDLPTDLHLAKVKVEEKRQELVHLEDRLKKMVDSFESFGT